MCISTESGCLGRSTMVMVSSRNRLRRYFSRRQISLRVTAVSLSIGRPQVAYRDFRVKKLVPASRRAWPRAAAAFVAFAGPPDLLTRFAGRSSPSIVRQFLDEMVHLLRGVFPAIAIDQLGRHAHGGAV